MHGSLATKGGSRLYLQGGIAVEPNDKHPSEAPADESYEAAAKEQQKREDAKSELIAKNELLFRRIKAGLGAFGLFAGYFFFPQLFFLVFSTNSLQNNGTIKLLASFMGFFVYFFFLIRYYTKRSHKTGESLNDILKFLPKELELKPAAVCAMLGFCLNLTSSSLLALLPLPESWLQGYSAGSESLIYTDSLAFSIIYIVLLAPLCEELMFRGFMYHRMRTAFSVLVSVIVVSIAFALPHINALWIIVATLNSFVFTMVRERYRNICYTILLHCCYNLASVPMILLLGSDAYTVLFDNVLAELIYLAVCGTACFFGIRYLLSNKRDERITYKIYSGSRSADEGVNK